MLECVVFMTTFLFFFRLSEQDAVDADKILAYLTAAAAASQTGEDDNNGFHSLQPPLPQHKFVRGCQQHQPPEHAVSITIGGRRNKSRNKDDSLGGITIAPSPGDDGPRSMASLRRARSNLPSSSSSRPAKPARNNGQHQSGSKISSSTVYLNSSQVRTKIKRFVLLLLRCCAAVPPAKQ